jgi:hypothetical protein
MPLQLGPSGLRSGIDKDQPCPRRDYGRALGSHSVRRQDGAAGQRCERPQKPRAEFDRFDGCPNILDEIHPIIANNRTTTSNRSLSRYLDGYCEKCGDPPQ